MGLIIFKLGCRVCILISPLTLDLRIRPDDDEEYREGKKISEEF